MVQVYSVVGSTCSSTAYIIIVILQALLVETLNEDDEKRPEAEMEITFEPGLQETAEHLVQRKLGEFYYAINPNC